MYNIVIAAVDLAGGNGDEGGSSDLLAYAVLAYWLRKTTEAVATWLTLVTLYQN